MAPTRTHRWARRLALLAVSTLALTACADGGGGGDQDANRGADAEEVTLTISANAISGGKNTEEADWIEKYVIPEFTKKMEADGVKATVKFESSGVEDEQYKSKLALDLRSRSGADIINVDGIWVGEFAEAGYIKPLDEVVGAKADEWDGWDQIQDRVQEISMFDGKRYGIPAGTDGRVLFYNKQLFEQAGLSPDWQPTSWQEILDAGTALKKINGVDPIQLNAGTAMGEATTMQGVLPLLVGTGAELVQDDKWLGDSEQIRQVLDFYEAVYGGGLGDPKLQQEAKGRDKSFADFAAGKIGILLESDYFWRSVVEPNAGIAPMKNRDEVVGFAKIPAAEAGGGVRGQDFVSMSGGGGRMINPNTKFPQQAWELLTFMNSAEATKKFVGNTVKVTARDDVNDETLGDDPMLKLITDDVLPITAFRPGLAAYPQVSVALQEATADVVGGKSVDEAVKAYQTKVEEAVGGADNVRAD